jgi:hypothetical protein
MNLKRHFQLAPMYSLNIPTHSVYQCGRQVAKSYGIAEKGILLSALLPDFHSLYVQPRFDQIKRFNTAIVQPLLRSIVIQNQIIDKDQVRAFHMRNFKRNSIMYMEFCLVTVPVVYRVFLIVSLMRHRTWIWITWRLLVRLCLLPSITDLPSIREPLRPRTDPLQHYSTVQVRVTG